MLKNIGLFCKRDLQKRPIFCKETYIFKHPTHRSHPIPPVGGVLFVNSLTFAVCCSVLQCVAVCCSVVQCSVVQCVAVCCNVLKLLRCSLLQSFAEFRSMLQCVGQCVGQCVAVCCSVLQCVAVCCSVLQCGAVQCSAVH